VGGQAAEQIIAGVVLSERLAVTMYGAIHRAQWSGQRNLRGLVIEPKLLAEDAFRAVLTDGAGIAAAMGLGDRAIVPTVAVESGGPDVVVVTRGVGRYVTVQDLISTARANRREGGKLPLPVAAAIARSVTEAVAAAHRAGVVHGAVHPRSVVIDEDGGVRLGDFVVGLALATAVAQGADSALWRGLSGYLSPELVIGEDPSPASDVFSIGALLFAMVTGELPPGSLHATPAVERLVQRALDTDRTRRYQSAVDLLENLLEAFEDDRWELADRGAIIRAAGLSSSDTSVDDATEDLLASLALPAAVTQTPARAPAPSTNARLDALLADLDEPQTEVDPRPHELIQPEPRKREAVPIKPRVPSLDDPDDETPLPAPVPPRDSEDDIPVQPVAIPATPRRVAPILAPDLGDVPVPRLKSRLRGVIALLFVAGLIGGVVYLVVENQHEAAHEKARRDAAQREREEAAAAETNRRRDALADAGAIAVRSTPAGAAVWLRLGRTPLDSLPLSSGQLHLVRVELDGYVPVDAPVLAAHWSGDKDLRGAQLVVGLQPLPRDARGRVRQIALPATPSEPPPASGFQPGRGAIRVSTEPRGAEAWLYLGLTDSVQLSDITAGRAYELRLTKDGYQPAQLLITPDEWRDPRDRPGTPIDAARKVPVVTRTVELRKRGS
jgi:hypothetical protein